MGFFFISLKKPEAVDMKLHHKQP